MLISLAASIFLHVVVLFLIQQKGSAVPAVERRKELVVVLRRGGGLDASTQALQSQSRSQPYADAQSNGYPSALSDVSNPLSLKSKPNHNLNAANQPQETPAQTRSLDLSLPSGMNDPPEKRASGGSSRNEAVVFDKRLKDRIQRYRAQEKRNGRVPIPEVDSEKSQSTFSGGHWETLLRVNDLCFRVLEADPLQPLSNEQWYRIECN